MNRKRTKISSLLFLLLFAGANLFAQTDIKPDASAKVSQPQFKIGEQITLSLKLHYNEGMKKSSIVWPELGDTIVKNLEVVKKDTISTSLVNRASVLYQKVQKITVTAYDSGTYHIPRFRFVVDNDTVYSDSLKVYVTTVDVDTSQDIKDIKDIYSVPAAPEISNSKLFLWIGLGALAIIAIVILILWYVRRDKKEEAPPPAMTRYAPPHEKVLEALSKLGMEKPWMSGVLKPYYISLTEILRGWIVERYQVPAWEMTSREIVRALHQKKAPEQAINFIERIMMNADMVKFAKGTPSMDDCERDLRMAFDFVNMTIPPVTPTYQQMFN